MVTVSHPLAAVDPHETVGLLEKRSSGYPRLFSCQAPRARCALFSRRMLRWDQAWLQLSSCLNLTFKSYLMEAGIVPFSHPGYAAKVLKRLYATALAWLAPSQDDKSTFTLATTRLACGRQWMKIERAAGHVAVGQATTLKHMALVQSAKDHCRHPRSWPELT